MGFEQAILFLKLCR